VTKFTAVVPLLFCVAFLSRASFGQQSGSGSNTIFLTASVTDRYGRYVSGLQREYFQVFEKKELLDIRFFSPDNRPASIAILFDLSRSMSGKTQSVVKAVNTFIQQSNKSNEYLIVGFNKQSQLVLDWSSSQDEILKGLSGVLKYKPNGPTALYDAIYLSLKKMASSSHPKHLLLILSDGQDDASQISIKEVRRMLRESDVVAYAIGILSGPDVYSSLGMKGQETLEELTKVSGAIALFSRSEDKTNDM